jgi:predicted glycoside hydrolase/deacetylase ChbG (UPF0249 family)
LPGRLFNQPAPEIRVGACSILFSSAGERSSASYFPRASAAPSLYHDLLKRMLVVNADDFGLTRGVNQGILRAHREGIVTSTTIMAGAPAFEHAVELARAAPALDTGVHLVLWPQDDGLPQRLPAFLARALSSTISEIEANFARQVEKVVAAGIVPSHLDTHKHTHLLPKVMSAVARVARRFGITWVRRPLFARQAAAAGLRTSDYFVGMRLTGRLDQAALLAALARLRPGLTELMCHPGVCDDDLRRAPTRLKEQRERELEALTSETVRSFVRNEGIELTSFRALEEGVRRQVSGKTVMNDRPTDPGVPPVTL